MGHTGIKLKVPKTKYIGAYCSCGQDVNFFIQQSINQMFIFVKKKQE